MALATWQPPEPSHAPVSPQGGLAGQKDASRGGTPGTIEVHVPGVAVQVWQLPVHAELQHTPCVQKPRPQSLLTEQLWPWFFLQAPLKHAYPLAASHALFEAQVVAQLPPVQR